MRFVIVTSMALELLSKASVEELKRSESTIDIQTVDEEQEDLKVDPDAQEDHVDRAVETLRGDNAYIPAGAVFKKGFVYDVNDWESDGLYDEKAPNPHFNAALRGFTPAEELEIFRRMGTF